MEKEEEEEDAKLRKILIAQFSIGGRVPKR
jgi:hypothetical protein